MRPYEVRYVPRASCYRIFQRDVNGLGWHQLEWMNFDSEWAAHEHVRLRGLPPLFKRERVKSYERVRVAA